MVEISNSKNTYEYIMNDIIDKFRLSMVFNRNMIREYSWFKKTITELVISVYHIKLRFVFLIFSIIDNLSY